MVRTGIARIKVDDKVIIEEIFELFFRSDDGCFRSIGGREFHRRGSLEVEVFRMICL